jgi:hypothetical protein
MADRVEELRAELEDLLGKHEPTMSAAERADLLRLESRAGWRPGSRPTRPEPEVSAFLDLFDRAEQEELTDRTLAGGSVDELRRVFRERLSTSPSGDSP